ATRAVELAVLGGLDARELRARADARALRHRLRAGLRLLAVRGGGRREPVRRLRASRCDLANPAHGRRAAAEGDRLGALGIDVGGARRRAGEPGYAARERDRAP